MRYRNHILEKTNTEFGLFHLMWWCSHSCHFPANDRLKPIHTHTPNFSSSIQMPICTSVESTTWLSSWAVSLVCWPRFHWVALKSLPGFQALLFSLGNWRNDLCFAFPSPIKWWVIEGFIAPTQFLWLDKMVHAKHLAGFWHTANNQVVLAIMVEGKTVYKD